ERVEILEAGSGTEASALSRADVLVLASEGLRPAPDTLGSALAAGVVPVAARLPIYDELLHDGEYGLQFEPGDAQTLANHLERLIATPELREGSRERIERDQPTATWAQVTDQLEDIYGRLAARRRDPAGDKRLRAKLSSRRLI